MDKYFIFLLIVLSQSAYSSTNFEYEKTINGVVVTTNGIKKRVSFYGDKIVQISLTKETDNFSDSSLVVLSKSEFSNFTIDDSDPELRLKTSSLVLNINKRTGAISFLDTDGNVYLEEHDKVLPELNDTLIFNQSYYKVKQSFKITEEEGLYGLGQFQNGYMNYRDKELLLVQANTISIVPVLTSTNNYGILWDNYSKTVFKEENNTASFTSEVADQIDYYFMAGNDMDEVVSAYREITGKAPMFSKKAYGYWQSKERYKSFDELHDVVKKYRENNIPLDNIVQDWKYWGDWSQFSSMYFEPINYPSPAENIKKLRANNVDIMVSIWPAVGPESKIYKELEEKGLLYGQGHWGTGEVFDTYSPVARDIYWKHIKEGLVKNGIYNFWMDGTEPQFFRSNTQEFIEEELLRVEKTAAGPVAKYLNTYALVNSQDVYEKHRAYTADKRVFILTRSAWAGQQRNGTVTWSGDTPANFETLKNQISAGVNISMAGIPYWTHDIGAFFPMARGGKYLRGIAGAPYQELYTRWFQFGAFTPIFRSHGTGTPREVWQLKDRNPMCYDALMKTLHMRYQLLPYIYSTAWKVTNEGYSFMRGLPMDFVHDKNTYAINDQYMFGASIMVKPITRNMYYEIEKIPPMISGENLRTMNDKEGLNVTWFKDEELKEVASKDIEKEINRSWSGGGFPEGVPANNFSARWEGYLIPSESGMHKLVIIADDGARMWIDEQLVVDQWVPDPSSPANLSTYEVKLEKGKKYKLRLEYHQNEATSCISLGWETPSYDTEETDFTKMESVYLPKHEAGWYDLWTNELHEGGQSISKEYPMDIFPLFVKAGSILPFGPKQQYVDEKPNEPIEIRIYSGADAEFTYYEDEGNNYNYEKGAFNTISFSWDDQQRKLRIGESTGAFTGYVKDKTFNIKVIEAAVDLKTGEEAPLYECKYDGSAIELDLK